MSPDTKAKITYVILAIFYFAGGIELGVSIPRGWLHWQQHAIEAPDHIIGLVVAAYSVATFFVAPFVGRWVDKPGRVKRVLVCGACLHITGAMFEVFLTQQWVIAVARLISGVGGGVDAAVLSETSRYTRPTRRTKAMALLVGARLVGYVLVPGLDALLWRVLLTDMQLPERRTAALGLFLVVMWTAVVLLTIILYTEMCRLQPLSSNTHTLPFASSDPSDYSNVHVAGTVPSELGDDYEVVHFDTSFSSSQAISVPPSLTSSQCSEAAAHRLLAKSSEMIEEAEKYIQLMAEQSCSSSNLAFSTVEIEPSQSGRNCEAVIHHEDVENYSDQMSTSFNHDNRNRNSSDSGRVTDALGGMGVSVTMSTEALDQNSYVKRSGFLPCRLQGQESVLYTMYEEFIRHDVIALLAIAMSGTFAHLCFQMLIIPVTQTFLEDEDVYVVIVFCLALILLVSACMSVWWTNPQHKALPVLVTGACLVILGAILFMVFLKSMRMGPENQKENMIQICVCVALYVVGSSVLLIFATSIFTFLSDHHHHGLHQGVYHSALSVSAILAPLWIEGTLRRIFLHHLIIVGLLVVSLIFLCCSWHRLSAQIPMSKRRGASKHTSAHVAPADRQNSERQPLLS